MKYFVAVTDNQWFRFLAERKPDEVNFWRPSSKSQFKAIDGGAPFLFKLHSPLNYIAGGGFLVRHSILPLSLAWRAFGDKNGSPDFETLLQSILRYRNDSTHDPIIGCTILAEPFFLREENWIPVPSDWKPNIVQGKHYNTDEVHGRALWAQVEERLNRYGKEVTSHSFTGEQTPAYGNWYLARARLGQGTFRILVTEAYQRRCAITGEKILPILESAHIRPFSKEGPNLVKNGILLRSDFHTLFDKGYITLAKDHHIEVSRRIKEEFDNGKNYYKIHGNQLEVIPTSEIEQPAPEFIEWHNENIYLG